MRQVVKALSVCMAVYASWFATSSIMARLQSGRQPEAAITKKLVDPEMANAASDLPVGARLINKAPAPFVKIERFTASFDGEAVEVAAAVTMYESSREVDYIWALRVYHQGGTKPVLENIYDHQAFQPPASTVVSPTFEERVVLPPGSYNVVLSLHIHKRGENLDQVKKDDGAATAVIRDFATVNIP